MELGGGALAVKHIKMGGVLNEEFKRIWQLVNIVYLKCFK